MLAFPNCKINLGLNIICKRADGFHDIETVFYPILKLHDALEILPSNTQTSLVDFKMSGPVVDGDRANNLCVKACKLLHKDYPEMPAIQMHLHKAIPMGAGLGGGSADGAFTLQLMNDVFHLKLSNEQLINYALQLGSDCPFFIVNKPCFATGRGEVMNELPFHLSGYFIVLINPGIHINTGWAFGQITPQQPLTDLKQRIQQPIETWKELVKNDFEPAVMNSHPIIGTIKERLYQNGAVFASMSGSGSTVYGIFSADKTPAAKLFPQFLELHLAL